jgi:hypothetical protein
MIDDVGRGLNVAPQAAFETRRNSQISWALRGRDRDAHAVAYGYCKEEPGRSTLSGQAAYAR